jgi:hypothetical protein
MCAFSRFHPNASDYWIRELQDFYGMVQWDGIWIDMNEIANFCNHDGQGQVCKMPESGNCPTEVQTDCCLDCELVDDTDPYDFPPFLPDVVAGSLGGKTISASSIHYGDIREYVFCPPLSCATSSSTSAAPRVGFLPTGTTATTCTA